MLAAAIFPILGLTLAWSESPRSEGFGLLIGAAMALLVGISRIEVGAHSPSEVLAGWVLGGAVSGMAFAASARGGAFVNPLLSLILVIWITAMPSQLPASNTHSLVTRLALAVSGHKKPFDRSHLVGTVNQ